MEAKAMARTVRIAPRKARLVIDLIRGKHVGEAYAILKHTPKAASPIVEKYCPFAPIAKKSGDWPL